MYSILRTTSNHQRHNFINLSHIVCIITLLAILYLYDGLISVGVCREVWYVRLKQNDDEYNNAAIAIDIGDRS